jgi:hypothetical protein
MQVGMRNMKWSLRDRWRYVLTAAFIFMVGVVIGVTAMLKVAR